jgi:Ca-activated chloride channel family protein
MLAILMACSSMETSVGPTPRGSRGVGQGGAQDIGRFRAVVAQGEVPTVDLLDPVGFFAEHALDLPPADCGERVCVHPMLAVAPRFDGGNWTMAFVAMNSSVDPASEPRPATHFVLAVEDTRRTDDILRTLPVATGEFVAGLRAEDRVTVVRIADRASIMLHAAAPSDPALGEVVRSIAARGTATSAALYDGLALASRALDGWEGARRVVILTSGRADAGISDERRVLELAEALARDRVSLSVIGLGESYVQRLPAAIGDLGTGTYAYAESDDALVEILRLESRTALVPLATDFLLRITAAPGYRIGRVYGARRAQVHGDRAELHSPLLVLGQRTGSRDVDGGRRGGGGGMFVELIADSNSGIGPGEVAFAVEASFLDARSGLRRTIQRRVVNELAPGQNPYGMWPFFSDPERGKPFMMLNMYLALSAVLDFYESGDCARALGVSDMMQLSVDGWQAVSWDPDIEADNALLLDLAENVATQCRSSEPVEPRRPEGFHAGCMFI